MVIIWKFTDFTEPSDLQKFGFVWLIQIYDILKSTLFVQKFMEHNLFLLLWFKILVKSVPILAGQPE